MGDEGVVRRARRRAIAIRGEGSDENFVPTTSVPDDLFVEEGDGVAVKPTPERGGFVRRHDEEASVRRKLLPRLLEDRAHGLRTEPGNHDDVDLSGGQGRKAASLTHFQLVPVSLAPELHLQVPYHVGQNLYADGADDATASEEGAWEQSVIRSYVGEA